MARTGLLLLAAASDGVGEPEEEEAQRIWRLAYTQGRTAGRKATIDEIEKRLNALDHSA